jgi:hypothetical protein
MFVVGGRRKPQVVDSGSSTKTSYADVWNNSILPDPSIYIRWSMLRFESSCRVVLSLCPDITRTPDRENHLLVFGWNIDLLVFGSNS